MTDEEVPRRWRSLDEEQRAVAAELVRRALELRDLSEDGLSVREAVELAAGAVQRRGLAATVAQKATADGVVPDER